MDRSRLAAAVFKKTGYLLGSDDPAWAVVEMNGIVVVEAVGPLVASMETLPEQIRTSAKELASEVACQGVQCVADALHQARQALAADTEAAQRRVAEAAEIAKRQAAAERRSSDSTPRAGATRAQWLLACAVANLVSLTVGVAIGQMNAIGLLQHALGR